MPAVTDRLPAPDRLAVLEAFVNTHDLIHRTDALATPDDLARWLTDRGILPDDAPAPDGGDLALAVRTREALRALLIANAGDAPVDGSAVATLNDVAATAGLTARLDAAGQPTLESAAPGVPGALGRVIGIALEAMTDGTWNRLKACHADDCRWAFYDRSKSGRGLWCETSATGCGARAKMRAFRGRSRPDDA
jgi:predicted RNA-binding Zn ribbon-like protein